MTEQQVHPKIVEIFDQIMSGKYDPVSAIVENETERGFQIVRPGDMAWFRASDWREASVASIDGRRVRLVLLHAFASGKGALTRTIEGIVTDGHKPAVIDPTRELAAALYRRGWRMRVEGSAFEDREDVWVPTKRQRK